MSKPSSLYLGQDEKGNTTSRIPWPSENQSYQFMLNAGTEETLSVPSWAYEVLISVPFGAVSCGYGDTPLTLASTQWQSQLSEINPVLRPLIDPIGNRIETLRFISYTDDNPINVIFYTKDISSN